MQGQWLERSTVFVSPRIVQGKSGAWVISVLRYSAAGQTQHIAVHRGWVAQTSAVDDPKPPALGTQAVVLSGELAAQLPRAFELSTPQRNALGQWPNYDASLHAKLLGIRMASQVLVLSPSSGDDDAKTLHRDDPANAAKQWQDKANKNLAYAVQWLLLASVGLIGLAWMLRSAKTPPQQTQAESNAVAKPAPNATHHSK